MGTRACCKYSWVTSTSFFHSSYVNKSNRWATVNRNMLCSNNSVKYITFIYHTVRLNQDLVFSLISNWYDAGHVYVGAVYVSQYPYTNKKQISSTLTKVCVMEGHYHKSYACKESDVIRV